MWDVVFAQAPEGSGTAPPAGQSPMPSLLGNPMFMIVALFAIMYFLMIRPNQKRERERREMLAALAKGDKVVTTGGVCGTVVGLNDKSVVIRVDDSVNIEFLRGAISQVTSHEKKEE